MEICPGWKEEKMEMQDLQMDMKVPIYDLC